MKGIKQLIAIAFCIIISFMGIYFQFFDNGDSAEGAEREEALPETSESEERFNQVPMMKEENETEDERYGRNYRWSVYFTNMEEIMEDDSFLPYQAYADMVAATEEFLNGQDKIAMEEGTDYELQLTEGMTYKKGNLISFHCHFADLNTDMEIEYVYDDIAMEYSDIHFTEKGEWEIPWRN